MSSTTETIIEELLSLDPALAGHEEKLRAIVEMMIAHRPESSLDEWFRRELRMRIDREIRSLHHEDTQKTSSPLSWILPFFLGGAVFASLMVVSPVGQYLRDMIAPATEVTPAGTKDSLAIRSNTPTQSTPNTPDLSKSSEAVPEQSTASSTAPQPISPNATLNTGRPEIARAPQPSNRQNVIAFGVDIKNTTPNAFGKITPSASPTSAKWMGGWVESLAMPTTDTENKIAAPSATSMSDDMSILPYNPTVYQYAYTGSDISLPKTLPVFKKEARRLESKDIRSLLSSFRFSLFDLSTLSTLRLDTMTLSEDQEYGLSTNIDLNAGTIWVSKNWTRWPQSKCQTEECFTKERVRITDIPDETSLLALADAFAHAHRVDMSTYGKPVINHDWKIEYARSNDANTAYVPETIYITYPLVINGYEVYEEYGARKWLNVGIDIKTRRVSEFTGLEYLPLVASDYPIDRDFMHLRSLINTNNVAPSSASAKEISLNTPKVVYARIARFTDGQNHEYLVPALRFETTTGPKSWEYFQTSVIIPIVQDFQTNSRSFNPYPISIPSTK